MMVLPESQRKLRNYLRKSKMNPYQENLMYKFYILVLQLWWIYYLVLQFLLARRQCQNY